MLIPVNRRWSRLGTFLGTLVLCLGSAAASPAVDTQSQGDRWIGVWLGDEIDGGLRIVGLVPGGPAEQGGLRPGDVIVRADGVPLLEDAGLERALGAVAPGGAIALQVLRRGEPVRVEVRPVARSEAPVGVSAWVTRWIEEDRRAGPPVQPARPAAPLAWRLAAPRGGDWGLDVVAIPDTLREHYGAPREAGVLVTRVDPEGLAGAAGLRVGDLVVRVDGDPVLDAPRLRSTLGGWRRTTPIRLEIVRDGDAVPLELQPSVRASSFPRPENDQDRETLRRRIELEIERLERRLEELRQERSALER